MNFICLISKYLTQINNSYFSKMVLENSRNKGSAVRLQCEPENFDAN